MQPKLGIGTVLFGMNYGITKSKQIPFSEIRKILEIAEKYGVKVIDTAPSYGNSEKMLGEALKKSHDFKIVTKTITFPHSYITKEMVDELKKGVYQSLNHLKQDRLYGLLVHQQSDLFKPNAELLFFEMKKMKEQGIISKIGVSIYTGHDIDQVLRHYDVDIIQVPINVLDQRLVHSGHLTRMKKRKIEIHARSVFLQGLLTMPVHQLPSRFKPLIPLLNKYHSSLKEKGYSLIEGAIHFVKGLTDIDYIIVGVNSADQLLEIIQAYHTEISFDYTPFQCHNEQIIDPRNW